MFGKVEILLEIINKPSCSKRILLKFQDFKVFEYGVGVHIRMGKKTRGNTTPKDEKKRWLCDVSIIGRFTRV